jgi:hypothetical protein
MDSRKTLFKFYDAFRMSAFLRLFIPFAVSLIGALIFASLFTSCERAVLSSDDDDIEEVVSKGKGELYVTCSYSQTQSEITRASSVSLSECATRVQYVIMQGETMVYNSEQINGGGNSFGTLSVNLEPGTYRLMVLLTMRKMVIQYPLVLMEVFRDIIIV